MNRTLLLLRTQLYNYFSINEILDSSSGKKSTGFIVGIGVITVVLFLCAYNVLTAVSLVQMGEQDLIPAYMVAVSSFAILLLTMFRSNGILFGSKDFEMLSALPVKSSAIISSKFMFMYLLNFILCFVFMVPGGIVWAVHSSFDLAFLLIYLMAVFFVPLIPMCFASFIGILIVVISSRFRNKNIFSLIFSFAAIGLIGYAGFASTQSGNVGGNIGAMLAGQVSGMYPLSRWFLMETGNPILGVGYFLVVSGGGLFCFIKIVAGRYSIISSFVLANSENHVSRNLNIKRHSRFWALYRKELGRFFSSYMYVLNTGLGVVLLCIMSILLVFVSPNTLGSYIGIKNINLGQYAPIIVAALLSLSCSTASSVSLEGKNVWILQSVPVSIKTIMNSKIAVNLTLHSVGYLIATLSITTRLQMQSMQIVTLLVVPVAYSIFTAVQGIYFNIRFPNFEWDNEIAVVKQSIPVIVSSALSMVIVAIPVLLNWFLSFPILPVLWGMAAILLGIAGVLYYKVCAIKFI